MEVSSWENHLFLWAILYGYVSHNQRVSIVMTGIISIRYSNNKPPIFDSLYHPFMGIRGMVYYCYTNIPHVFHLRLLGSVQQRHLPASFASSSSSAQTLQPPTSFAATMHSPHTAWAFKLRAQVGHAVPKNMMVSCFFQRIMLNIPGISQEYPMNISHSMPI